MYNSLAQQYPNSELEVQVRSSKTPDVSFRRDHLDIALYSATDLAVHRQDNTVTRLFTVNANLTLSLRVSIQNEKLIASVADHNIQVDLRSTPGFNIKNEGLSTVLGYLSNAIVIPRFNTLGSRGILLPVSRDIKFRGTTLQLLDGAIMVATDRTLLPAIHFYRSAQETSKKMYVATLALLCLLAVSQSIAVNPGVKMRVTQKGFDYVNDVARRVIAAEVQKLNIGNKSGSSGRISWSLNNNRIRSVTAPGSNLRLNPGQNGLTWQLSNFGIKLSTDWRVRYKRGWIKASTSGGANVDVSGVSLTVTVGFGVDSSGRPTIVSRSCSESIGSLRVRFTGGKAWLYNLFKGIASRKLKDALNGQICKVVNKAIRDDANRAVRKMTVTQELDHKFILDYGLVSPPAITSNYLETKHKGQITWKATRQGAPFTPAPLPTSTAADKMLYVWGSDFVAKSIAHVAQVNNYLQYDITKDDLSPSDRIYLDTTCSGLCAGTLIPELGQQYPNSELEVQVRSSQTPDVTFRRDHLDIALYSATDLVVRRQDNTVTRLFTVNANLTLSLRLSIQNEKLIASVADHDIQVGLSSPHGFNVNNDGLNTMLGYLSNAIVIPRLNTLGSRGILLPVSGDIKFRGTTLQLLDGAIMVATDVSYTYSP